MAVTSADITNTYQKVLTALTSFQTFLDGLDLPALKNIIDQVKQHVPQVGAVVATLITLLQELKTAVDSAGAASLVTDVSKIEDFAGKVAPLLVAAESLIPAQQSTIDEVLKVTQLVAGFPNLAELQSKIDTAIGTVIADLQKLQ
jgi:C4-dicarboxylate transporter